MNKYLLFSFSCYYPTGGMGDCIYIADSIEELNDYAKEYIKKQGYPDDFMEYYDVQKTKCIWRTAFYCKKELSNGNWNRIG